MEISATGGAEVQFNLLDFYRKRDPLLGVDSLKHDLVRSARALDAMRPEFESGMFRPAPVAATFRIVAAAEAYRRVAAGARGRIVLTPQL